MSMLRRYQAVGVSLRPDGEVFCERGRGGADPYYTRIRTALP
jgi:hypothetical protein